MTITQAGCHGPGCTYSINPDEPGLSCWRRNDHSRGDGTERLRLDGH